MVRAPWLLLILFVVSAAPSAAQAPSNAVFVADGRASFADFSWWGPCNGEVTIRLELPAETRTVTAQSVMVPALCDIGCPDCVLPFSWTLLNKAENVRLTGGGVAPGAASLQGTFQEGLLEVRFTLV